MMAIVTGNGRIAGLEAEELAAEFGTPMYVYDLDLVARRVAALREALPRSIELAYAAKANPAKAILDQMRLDGLGLDVASGGELAAALEVGFDPRGIVMTGPGKSDVDLRAAVAAGLRAITVESSGELVRLECIAAEAARRVPVLLRVAVQGDGETSPILAGGWRKFGIDPGDLDAVACAAVASPWIEPIGLHAFGASNVRDPDVIAQHVGRTVELAARLARAAGFRLQLVDAGGGLGIPYRDDEEPLDLSRFTTRMATLAAAWSTDPELVGVRVLLEPGRYLVGPAGVVVTRVLDVKRVAGRTVAIVDAGMQTAIRPALVGRGHTPRLLATGERASGDVLVAGPLCTGLDVLPEPLTRVPRVGDLVAVPDLGAYGFTEAMPLFLSHPVAAEVVVRSGSADRLPH